MSDDLHRSVWLAYRSAIYSDRHGNAAASFQAAVDIVLRNRPGVDPLSACREATRMVMMRPFGTGVGPRRVRPRAGAILAFPVRAVRQQVPSRR